MPVAALKNPASPRRRLTPEKRQELILDRAADIVSRDGVAALNMDRIGREAGVSKGLVYNYFPNLTALLQTLLQRELRRMRRLQTEVAEKAETFEGLVRGLTHVYLCYIEDRGLLIERLQAEPSVASILGPTVYSREPAVDYLSDIIIRNFDLPPDVARAATDISFGLPATAGAYLIRHSMDRQTLEDVTVTMILGTFTHLSSEYRTKRQPLR